MKKSRSTTFYKVIFESTLIFTLFLKIDVSSFAQEWVSFNNSHEPRGPQVKLISSNNKEVVFSCEFFGFYVSIVNENEYRFNRISIPMIASNQTPGDPELPYLNVPIAISKSVKPELEIEILDQIRFQDYYICPSPLLVPVDSSNIPPHYDECFLINKRTYGLDLDVPDTIAKSLHIVNSGIKNLLM
jgi:hypothetical protein